MDNLQQLPQFLLALSEQQKNIIQAHAMASINALATLKFTSANKEDMMLAHAFEQGKLAICSALQTYDQEQLQQAQERNHNQEE